MTRQAVRTALGFVLLAAGAIGVFLPIWPTTPFVLLAAACFSGNPRLHARVMRIRFFREHAINYRERTGLPLCNLVFSLCFLWAILLISGLLTQKLWAAVLLASVGIAVTIHLACMARPGRKPHAPAGAPQNNKNENA